MSDRKDGYNSPGMKSCVSCEWTTPDYVFEWIRSMWHTDWDACATAQNAKCDKFWTEEDDALKQDWKGKKIFCNPPYGKALSSFVKKAFDNRNDSCIVMLIPARTDTRYWHNYIFGKAKEIWFVKGRLKFGGGQSAPFPSAIIVFRKTYCYENDSTEYHTIDFKRYTK